MAGIGCELSIAADADVGAAIIDGRRRCAHAAKCQLTLTPQLPCPIRVLLHLYAVEIAALGGEVEGICLFVIADGAADVAGKAGHRIEQLAAHRVEQEQPRCAAAIPALAVVRADQHIVLARIRPRPIETAFLHIAPARGLGLCRVFGIFIRQGQADIARVFHFGVPESGVGVAV